MRDVGIRRRFVRAYGQGFSGGKDEARETQTGKEAQTTSPGSFDARDASKAMQTASPHPSAKTVETVRSLTRDQVLNACISTSTILGAVGVGIYLVAPYVTPAKGTEAFDTLHASSLVGDISVENGMAALATAGTVTIARALLLSVWHDFRMATNTSNSQVLVPLDGNPTDIAIVGSVPALAEEFLFRFALLPAISPDWRGAIISGLVFGALHVNGGRNLAFAAWASAVGTAYGALFLYTGSLVACVGAHALANVLSAWLWWTKQFNNDEPL